MKIGVKMLNLSIEKNVQLLQRTEFMQHYLLSDGTDTGHLVVYHIVDGVDVMYVDCHVKCAVLKFDAPQDAMAITHCYMGEVQFELDSEDSLEGGDLGISRTFFKNQMFSFPTKTFHGVTIVFSSKNAVNEIQAAFCNFNIDFNAVYEKVLSLRSNVRICSDKRILNIFSELYLVPKSMRLTYLKLKILEIFAYLKDAPLIHFLHAPKRLSRKNEDKIELVVSFIRENLDEHYTIEDLASKLDMSATLLKKCFKTAYGESIYAYLKNYRMKIAAEYLAKDELPIFEIANRVGYINSSKFTAAFKQVIGQTPKEYRSEHV